jgi:hypothetical protein
MWQVASMSLFACSTASEMTGLKVTASGSLSSSSDFTSAAKLGPGSESKTKSCSCGVDPGSTLGTKRPAKNHFDQNQ